MEFFIQKLDKDEETGETINIDLADIINKIWENLNAFKKLKTKMKIYNNPKTKTVLTYSIWNNAIRCKCNNRIWQKQSNRNKDLEVQKVHWTVLKVAFVICESQIT